MASAKTFRYTVSHNTWHPFADLNQAVIGNGGGVLGGVLFTFGGGTNISRAISPAPSEYSLQICGELVTAEVKGTVTNGITGLPIEGVLIEAIGTGNVVLGNATLGVPTPTALTGPDGKYSLVLFAPATYQCSCGCRSHYRRMSWLHGSIDALCLAPDR